MLVQRTVAGPAPMPWLLLGGKPKMATSLRIGMAFALTAPKGRAVPMSHFSKTLVELRGIEPLTSSLRTMRSPN